MKCAVCELNILGVSLLVKKDLLGTMNIYRLLLNMREYIIVLGVLGKHVSHLI